MSQVRHDCVEFKLYCLEICRDPTELLACRTFHDFVARQGCNAFIHSFVYCLRALPLPLVGLFGKRCWSYCEVWCNLR